MPRSLVAAAALTLAATAVQGQTNADFHWERAAGANRAVSIHNINGDITVKLSTNGKIEVNAFTRGSGRNSDQLHADVQETSQGVVVCVMNDVVDSTCDERGLHTYSNRWGSDAWGRARMDLEISVPAGIDVTARSVSGGVRVVGVRGDVDATSTSGDIRLERIQGSSVRGRTTSGDVIAYIETLTGSGDLSFRSTSGDVTLELPKVLDADLSLSTVSGNMESDYALTLNGRMSRRRIEARVGKGGRALDVSTVSGNVRLRASKS
jgi:DUF4097 and DUF4098 domain-containing protein YvlB